jgi:hypothetical protein
MRTMVFALGLARAAQLAKKIISGADYYERTLRARAAI